MPKLNRYTRIDPISTKGSEIVLLTDGVDMFRLNIKDFVSYLIVNSDAVTVDLPDMSGNSGRYLKSVNDVAEWSEYEIPQVELPPFPNDQLEYELVVVNNVFEWSLI